MAQTPCLLSIDQGTTSSRAIIFNRDGLPLTIKQEEFPQIFPQEGWVEHDPEAIWQTSFNVVSQAITTLPAQHEILSIGITNQRETTVIWNKKTGKPIYNAIVWQDRRTAEHCRQLKEAGFENTVSRKTGLLLDPYFSATKIGWLLDNVHGARADAEKGELAFGTIDCFLLWRLTGGKVHATDATNASRTLIYNIHTHQWDEELLKLFNIPASILPEVRNCAADYGKTELFGKPLPIGGIAGDQQAAAIGQCCFSTGMVKSTYGTGCFVLMNTGDTPATSKNKLLTTIAYQLNGKAHYALEGSIFIAGAAVQWLRDSVKLVQHASETEALAASLGSNKGVYLVPAFTGLGAPYWNPEARGALFGLTRDKGVAEITRATLESIAYQTYDLIHAMSNDGIHPELLRVDGGMVKNNWLMQFLADVLHMPVSRPVVQETTALGAAYLAGLQAGLYGSLDDIKHHWQEDKRFAPAMGVSKRDELVKGWHKAVGAVMGF